VLERVSVRYVGPSLHLSRDTKPGDGQFSVVLATKAERSRLLDYLENWKDDREEPAVLPQLRGGRLQIEWAGFPLHIDDKLLPNGSLKAKEMAGKIDVRIGGAS